MMAKTKPTIISAADLARLNWVVEGVNMDSCRSQQRHDGTDFRAAAEGLCFLRAIEQPEIGYILTWTAHSVATPGVLGATYDYNIELRKMTKGWLDRGGVVAIVCKDPLEAEVDEAEQAARKAVLDAADWRYEVRKHLLLPGVEGGEGVETGEKTDMPMLGLVNDEGADVSFRGERVAHVSSRQSVGPRHMRWTELWLYRTNSGKFVCHEKKISLWDEGGEHDHFVVHVGETEGDLIELLGHGRLAKQLYEKAGLHHVIEID